MKIHLDEKFLLEYWLFLMKEMMLRLFGMVHHQMNLWSHVEDLMIMIKIKISIKEYYHQLKIFEIHLMWRIMFQDGHTRNKSNYFND
jgi:hypothetical protein